MQFINHLVDTAQRKSITSVSGTYDCVGVDYYANSGTPSYYSLVYSAESGETMLIIDTAALFFTKNWLISY